MQVSPSTASRGNLFRLEINRTRRMKPAMSDSKTQLTLEEDICIHIFTVSAAMVGVCLTVIGLIRIVITLQKNDTLADNLLAGDALLFLTSCILSYWAMRTRKVRRM